MLLPAYGQTADTVSPDRPSFSTSTHITAAHHVQLEGGASRARFGDTTSYDVGELLVRVGITERFELRAGVPSYISSQIPSSHASGADDSLAEGKILLKSGSRLALGALVSAILPTGSHAVAEHTFQPSGTLITDINVSKSVSVTANARFGRSTTNGIRFNDVSGVTTLNFALPSNTSLFTEILAFNQLDDRTQKYVKSGISKMIGRRFEIDASGGQGLHNGAHGPDRFYGAGISHLF